MTPDEINIAIVGPQAAGKTSIIHKYLYNDLKKIKNPVIPYLKYVKFYSENSIPLNLIELDLNNLEDYKDYHKINGVIVVFEEFYDLDMQKWLKQIISLYGNEFPIILAFNKSDLHHYDYLDEIYRIASHYSEVIKIFQTSAINGKNVKSIFNAMIALIIEIRIKNNISVEEYKINFVKVNDKIFYEKDRILKLNDLNITSISEILNLDNLINLKELNLQNNKIEKIEGLQNLKKLKILILKSNNISYLKDLEITEELEELDLSVNYLNDIRGLEKLKKLRTLDLSDNKIIKIAKSPNFDTIETLRLNNNSIKDLKFLKYFPNLKSLSLRNNKIISMDGIESSKHLQILNIAGNIINEVSNLEQLSNLREINIDNASSLFKNYFQNSDYIFYDDQKIDRIEKKINFLSNLNDIEKPALDFEWEQNVKMLIENLTWVKKHRFLITGCHNMEDIIFRRLNIFIGKNNSGKTYTLTKIHDKCDFIIDNPKIRLKSKLESYFIPKYRILDKAQGTKKSFFENLANFLDKMQVLQKNKIKTYKNVSDKEDSFRLNLWKIPSFIEIIDLFSYKYEEDNRTLEEIRELLKSLEGKLLLDRFREIFNNWSKTVNDLLDDIEIKKTNEFKIGFVNLICMDKILQKEITNWNDYGSGTQELLSLIFIIEFLKLMIGIDYKKLNLDLKSLKVNKLRFNEYICRIKPNRILFIDEPFISLHPKLQKKFFHYLLRASNYIQIFIATHSTEFLEIDNFFNHLDTNISLILCLKSANLKETKPFSRININPNNLMRLIDEVYDFLPLENAFYRAKNNYEFYERLDYSSKDFYMGVFINDCYSNYSELMSLKNLGTVYEDPKDRIIQNTYFLCFNSDEICLQANSEDINILEKVYVCQINKYPNCTDGSNLIEFCCHCWDESLVKEYSVLKYTQDQVKDRYRCISDLLAQIKLSGLSPFKSIIVFPENTVPYDAIEFLIDFASKNKVIIVGGMEHRRVSNIRKILKDLPRLIHLPQYDIDEDPFINQAIIINADKSLSFQIKHIPVYLRRNNITEGIPIITRPNFRKFLTCIGYISVFICKDFLVNYEIINKWMDLNNIKILTIPSFSELYLPFRNKFGELVSKHKSNKIFIFSNVANYGGSGIYHYSLRHDYENGNLKLLKSGQEDWNFYDFKENKARE